MFYITGLLNHLKHIQACLARIEGEAFLNAKDLVLQVRARGRIGHLQPQFSFTRDGRVLYTPYFGPHVRGFIGWRPYFNKRWELATEKLRFKAFAAAHGLRTPAYWLAPGPEVENVLIKQNRSSFGVGIRGPFYQIDLANAAHWPEKDDYYEAFVPGRIAKAWYWNGALTCLELRTPPELVGDGRRTVGELAASRCSREVDAQALGWLAQYQGLGVNSVLPTDESMTVDFKYATPYDPPCYDNENVLSQFEGTPIAAQLEQAGTILAQAIPETVRANTLFTLDAVVDAGDRVWLLEMNSNPMVHPDVYPAMMASLFPAA